MVNSKDKKYQKIVEEAKNLTSLGNYYKEETKNILSGILSETGWDTAPISPYESIAFITVPGILEFGGIYKSIKNLIKTGLPVYFKPKLMSFFDNQFTPNLFKEFKEKEVLDLFRKSDPKVIGLAAEVLKYYHQGRIHLKKNFRSWNAPEGFSGYEYNSLLALSRASVSYQNNPFSKELTMDIFNWKSGEGEKGIALRIDLESRALNELSNQIKKGFVLGRELKNSRILAK